MSTICGMSSLSGCSRSEVDLDVTFPEDSRASDLPFDDLELEQEEELDSLQHDVSSDLLQFGDVASPAAAKVADRRYRSAFMLLEELLAANPAGVSKTMLKNEFEKKFRFPLRLDEVRCRDIDQIIDIFMGFESKQFVDGCLTENKHTVRYRTAQVTLFMADCSRVMIHPQPSLLVKHKKAVLKAKEKPRKGKAAAAKRPAKSVKVTRPRRLPRPPIEGFFMTSPADAIPVQRIPDCDVGTFFECEIVESQLAFNDLYLIYWGNVAALTSMMHQMALFYAENLEASQLDVTVMPKLVGLTVAALYCDNDGCVHGWHRAKVMSVSKATVKVIYVDYGCVGEVTFNAVALLPKRFARLPCQAIRAEFGAIEQEFQPPPPSADEKMMNFVRTRLRPGLVAQVIGIDSLSAKMSLVLYGRQLSHHHSGSHDISHLSRSGGGGGGGVRCLNKELAREDFASVDPACLLDGKPPWEVDLETWLSQLRVEQLIRRSPSPAANVVNSEQLLLPMTSLQQRRSKTADDIIDEENDGDDDGVDRYADIPLERVRDGQKKVKQWLIDNQDFEQEEVPSLSNDENDDHDDDDEQQDFPERNSP